MPTKKTTTKISTKKEKTIKPAKPAEAKVKVEKIIKPKIIETQPEEIDLKTTPDEVDEIKEEIKTEPESVKNNDRIEKYYESVGRRKEATARVRVYTKKSTDIQEKEDKAIIVVNDQPYFKYFNSDFLQDVVDAPLKKLKSLNRFKATVKVNGGGIHGQADAIKFGLSRALVLFDSNFSKKLRKAGYLTRDSREKERRKYGLKKARKAPSWAKR